MRGGRGDGSNLLFASRKSVFDPRIASKHFRPSLISTMASTWQMKKAKIAEEEAARKEEQDQIDAERKAELAFS